MLASAMTLSSSLSSSHLTQVAGKLLKEMGDPCTSDGGCRLWNSPGGSVHIDQFSGSTQRYGERHSEQDDFGDHGVL